MPENHLGVKKIALAAAWDQGQAVNEDSLVDLKNGNKT